MTLDDRMHFKLLVPEGDDEIEIFDTTSALRMGIIERGMAISSDWDVPGVYLLLDAPDADGNWQVYVGKAPSGLKSRVRQHKSRSDWRRAILVQRDSRFGFNSAEVGWLEGRLWDLVKAAEHARLLNVQRPGDDTLPAHELRALETMIDPISGVLRVIGNDPAPRPDDSETATEGRSTTPKQHGIKLADMLEAGSIDPGVRLVSTSPGAPAEAVLNADGTIAWNGKDYPTPSAAGCAVRDGQATNGWVFWAVPTETGVRRLSVLRAEYEDSQGD